MSIEQQMLRYVNIARQQPTYFVSLIDKQLNSFINEREMPINEQIIYETNEGISVWKEALVFLQHQKPLPALEEHQGLTMAAHDHARDLAYNGIFGHTGSDGSSFSQRILKHCRKGHGSMAELIGADFYFPDRNHAQMTILGLIIDDGVPDRGHRKTIFNSSYKYMGCKSQTQGEKILTVFNLTENCLNLRGQSALSSSGSSFNNTGKSQNFRSTAPKQLELNSKYPKEQFSTSKFCRSEYKENESQLQSPKRLSNDLHYNNSYELKSQTKSGFNQMNKTREVGRSPQRLNSTIEQFVSSGGKSSNLQGLSSIHRKVLEKRESSQIYYEGGSKITETTTKLVYNDGTVEEKVDRQTMFLE